MNKYEVLPSNSFGFICRTCLVHTELFSIEEVSWEGIDLKEIILNWTSLDFDVTDRFPRLMCSKCIRLMYQTYHFLFKCKSSEWILKSICLREEMDNSSQSEITTELTEDDLVRAENGKRHSELIINEPKVDVTIEEMPEEGIHKEEDADILQQIESIKSDITKIRADQKLQLSEGNKFRMAKSDGKDGCKGLQFTCNICTATFNTRQGMREHKQNKHRRYFKFACERCGNRYQQIQQLVAHTRIHTGERPFKCTLCGKCFTFKSLLKKHVLRHMDFQKSYECLYCDKVFSAQHLLRKHESLHARQTEETIESSSATHDPARFSVTMVNDGYQCNVCSKVLQSAKVLSDHFRLHGPKNHVCDVCGKSYISKERLTLHVKNTHDKNKVFQCERCSEIFTTNRALQLHMRSHADRAKPFVCKICGKAFRHQTNLRIHMQNHDGDSTYACNTCESGFSDFQSLKKHIITHA